MNCCWQKLLIRINSTCSNKTSSLDKLFGRLKSRLRQSNRTTESYQCRQIGIRVYTIPGQRSLKTPSKPRNECCHYNFFQKKHKTWIRQIRLNRVPAIRRQLPEKTENGDSVLLLCERVHKGKARPRSNSTLILVSLALSSSSSHKEGRIRQTFS